MIKNDFGHLGCPYYEEKLENGITLIVVPRKSRLKSAGIYIGKGALNNTLEVNGAKLGKGTAYLTKERIRSKDFQDALATRGIVGSSSMDYSYTYYSLSSLDDVLPGLKRLRERIIRRNFAEEGLDRVKQGLSPLLRDEKKKPANICLERRLSHRYASSPLKDSLLPKREEANNTHVSSLRRFVESYYVPRDRVVFLSMDEKPSTMVSLLSSLLFPADLTIYEKKTTSEESSDVLDKLSLGVFAGRGTYLGYGFKFPHRKDLYEHYGRSLFPKYELRRQSYFSSPSFLSSLADRQGELLLSSFKQGGEESCVSLILKVRDEKPVLAFLKDYFGKLDNRLRKDDFALVKREYEAKARKNLALPHLVLSHFAINFPNHIPYPSLVALTKKEGYTGYRRFGEDISSFSQCAYILKGNQNG